MKLYGFIIPILIMLFVSCNMENEEMNSVEKKNYSTTYASVDTFYLDTQETKSDYETYPEKGAAYTSTQKRATDLLTKIENREVKVLFHGIITEPFWDIYLTEKEMLVVDRGSNTQEFFFPKAVFDRRLDSQVIEYEDISGKEKKLTIRKEPSGDGMSDRTYPYSLLIDDWRGGGDSKLITDQ